jgi:hypothetical protein
MSPPSYGQELATSYLLNADGKKRLPSYGTAPLAVDLVLMFKGIVWARADRLSVKRLAFRSRTVETRTRSS